MHRSNKAGLRECQICRAKVKPSGFSIHVSKCRKGAIERGERKVCQFNALHCVPTAEYARHLISCPDKNAFLVSLKQKQQMEIEREILEEKKVQDLEINNNLNAAEKQEQLEQESLAKSRAKDPEFFEWDREDEIERDVDKDIIYEDEEYDPEKSIQRASNEKCRKLISLKSDPGKMKADDAFTEYLRTKRMDQLIINRMDYSERKRYYQMVNDFNASRKPAEDNFKEPNISLLSIKASQPVTVELPSFQTVTSEQATDSENRRKFRGIGRGRSLASSK